jgi:hypothetical protein
MGKDRDSIDALDGPPRSEPRGKPGARRRSAGEPRTPPSEADRPTALPDLFRRVMALGLSSFFTTEEAIRKAVGDTLPQDWIDFARQQSDRTRAEMIDRLAAEFGRVVQSVDLAELAERVLEGRSIEITARVRLGEREEGRRGTSLEFRVDEGSKGKA